MPEKTSTPTDHDSWLAYLVARKLPSALSIYRTCIEKMEKASPSYIDLANILAPDPVLSLAVMRKANEIQREQTVFSKTLDHAMSMIGHEKIKEILIKTPKLETKYGYRAYYQAQDASLTRAFLAQQFADKKGSARSQDVFWGSLFADAAEWYLWCYATAKMRKVQAATQANQKQVAEEEFGCDLRELQLSILQSLGAPELALQTKQNQQCLSPRDWVTLANYGREANKPKAPVSSDAPPSQPLKLSPPLKIARQNPLFYIELSRFYLHYYLNAINPKQMSRAVAVTSAGLDMHADDVRQLVTQILIKSARKYSFPYSQTDICKAFTGVIELPPRTEQAPQPGDKTTVRDKPSFEREIPKTKKPTPGTIEITSTQKKVSEQSIEVFTPEESFLKLLRKMKGAPGSFESAAELMQLIVKEICAGLRLDRCVIYILNKDKTMLRSYSSVGIEISDPLYKMQTPIVKGTIFKVLTEKASALWLKPNTKQELVNLVPMNFKQATQRDECFFASVFARGKPVAVFYADGEHGSALNEAQFRYFKIASTTLESTLEYLGNRKANNAK